MELRLDDATPDDVSRALETMLAAGMSLGINVTQDAKVLADAYWWALRGSSKVALQTALEETLQFGSNWIPAANELRRRCWEIDHPKRTAVTGTVVDVLRVSGYDDVGPIGRYYPAGVMEHLALVSDVRCPERNCECDAVEVWLSAAAFGGPTHGWALRSAWMHVAMERKLKRAIDWHPLKGDLR